MNINNNLTTSTETTNQSSKKNNTFILGAVFALLLTGTIGYFIGINKKTGKLFSSGNQIPSPQPKQSSVIDKSTPSPSPEVLKCQFSSKWFGFSYNYSKTKIYATDSCYEAGRDHEITDYSWTSAPFGLTFYPRNNLSDKEWWRKHIFDEAGYLSEDKYVFDFSETKKGVEKMSVLIDNNKVNPAIDNVGAGPFRGSYYYFGEKWVIREKLQTTGGPAFAYREFEESLELIPIKDNL